MAMVRAVDIGSHTKAYTKIFKLFLNHKLKKKIFFETDPSFGKGN